MRAAIRDNGGTAVEGKTLGDGVLAVFTSAKQAIACARACHEALARANLMASSRVVQVAGSVDEARPPLRTLTGGFVSFPLRSSHRQATH